MDDKHLVELRYEDLVRDPVGELRTIYERLGLEGFERVRPKLEQYVAERKDYRTNLHELPDHLRVRIAERWRGYAERYGYDLSNPGRRPEFVSQVPPCAQVAPCRALLQ